MAPFAMPCNEMEYQGKDSSNLCSTFSRGKQFAVEVVIGGEACRYPWSTWCSLLVHVGAVGWCLRFAAMRAVLCHCQELLALLILFMNDSCLVAV